MASVDFSVVKDQPDVLTSIEKLQAEIDTSQDSSALFETDEFRIYCYKVSKIPYFLHLQGGQQSTMNSGVVKVLRHGQLSRCSSCRCCRAQNALHMNGLRAPGLIQVS